MASLQDTDLQNLSIKDQVMLCPEFQDSNTKLISQLTDLGVPCSILTLEDETNKSRSLFFAQTSEGQTAIIGTGKGYATLTHGRIPRILDALKDEENLRELIESIDTALEKGSEIPIFGFGVLLRIPSSKKEEPSSVKQCTLMTYKKDKTAIMNHMTKLFSKHKKTITSEAINTMFNVY
ncbi:MAG: hypothetical protein UT34_C0002G0319 [candidate division WS6 bacterium GW2011_GWF2_39_15]|uniref:Uncharacterized protein n=1 Tax=candidate division WS6 bacterium GW2011_GWF2_39_15 TaxID=1619100 RepID=A0A0G0QW08_9BACT|nr:MAG: hypothetical protein UT34_C0002G0319 [candidate division WS6 bacterium GW2011_GWF2_39_15]